MAWNRAVISDIKVLGSTRGLAIVIAADIQFDAQFQKINKNTVKVNIKNCVYGLNSYSFTNYSDGVPVVRLNVDEIKNTTSVELNIELLKNADIKIETQRKGTQWIALLTRSSFEKFSWSALESEKSTHNSEKSTSGKAEKTAFSASVDSSRIKSASAIAQRPDLARLVNVRFLQRNSICALNFELDKPAQNTVVRSKDTVCIRIQQATLGLKHDNISIPSSTLFKSIKIKEMKDKTNPSIMVAVLLNKKINSNNGVVYTKDNTVTLFANNSESEKISQWNSDVGETWEEELYKIPSYNVDMKYYEKRATSDAESSVKDETAFFVKDDKKQNSSSITKVSYSKTNIENNESESQMVLPDNKKEIMIVIVKNASLREESISGSEVKGRLSLGNRLEVIDKKGQWYNVKFNLLTGWINEKYICDSSKVSRNLWKEINESQAVISPVTEKPIIDDNNALESPDTLIADTSAKTEAKRVIKYNAIGRDPFLPLANDTTGDSDGANVEHLKLVGVLIDNTEEIALFEDVRADKKPFALRVNDPVDHGKVLKIYKDKVVFLITEYGISRSYTIRLVTKQEQEAAR
jgi:L-lactate utilization protein LutC